VIETAATSELPKSGGAYIEGCTGNLSYIGGSKSGYFQTTLHCLNKCGVITTGGGITLADQMPQETEAFLRKFCGVARGILDQDGNRIKTTPKDAPEI